MGHGDTEVQKENRRYPRKEKKLPLNLKIDNSDAVVGESVNLSCIGAYCTTTRHIPEMTKLKINMMLPLNKKANKFSHVECCGVVVRTYSGPPGTGIHNLAIYFNEIDEYEINKIASFMDSDG